jgi:hypothetical protein
MRSPPLTRAGRWAFNGESVSSWSDWRAWKKESAQVVPGLFPPELIVVFWIMDNGSSHRGEASVRRLTLAHPRSVPVHVPVHAGWLNQIEIYFSIVQRKALTTNDFPCLQAVAERLESFERYYESIAHPFEWKFICADLNAMLARMRARNFQNLPSTAGGLNNTCANFRNGLLNYDRRTG